LRKGREGEAEESEESDEEDEGEDEDSQDEGEEEDVELDAFGNTKVKANKDGLPGDSNTEEESVETLTTKAAGITT